MVRYYVLKSKYLYMLETVGEAKEVLAIAVDQHPAFRRIVTGLVNPSDREDSGRTEKELLIQISYLPDVKTPRHPLSLSPLSSSIRPVGVGSGFSFPFGMKEGPARFVGTLIGVSTEIVALGLDQIGGEAASSQLVVLR